MDSIAGLLDAVTRPPKRLRGDFKKKEESGETPSATTEIQAQESVPSAPASAAATEAPAAATNATEPSPAQPPEASGSNPATVESVEEKILLANPPQTPHPALRCIVNILTIGECSGRTFQHTLALIQHLSFLPDARDVITQELKLKAHDLILSLSADLDVLILALQTGQAKFFVS